MTIGRNDYPWPNAACGACCDAYGYSFRQCVSFANWRIVNDLKLPKFGGGSAVSWAANAQKQGIPVDHRPAPGAIAQFPPGVQGAFGAGHVAFVTGVNADGSINIEDYDWGSPGCGYHWHTVGSSGVNFLHFGPPSPPPPPASNWVARRLMVRAFDGLGYVMDFWGGLHPLNGAPALSGAPFFVGWDIARALAVQIPGGPGYLMDGWGGVHPMQGAPPITTGPYWQGWDIARDLVITDYSSGRGYVLDGWGGVHPLNGAPFLNTTAFWAGWDIAYRLALTASGRGYVLDRWGGLHPVGGAPYVSNGPSWPGWDIARAVVVKPDVSGGYVLDGLGGMHPFGNSPPPATAPNRFAFDIARDVVISDWNTGSGWILDGWGGVHPIGLAPALSASAYWSGGRYGSPIMLPGGGVILTPGALTRAGAVTAGTRSLAA